MQSVRLIDTQFTGRSAGACSAGGQVKVMMTTGESMVPSVFCELPPGGREWPLLGCTYRSTDGADGPFGKGRSAVGLLGMKIDPPGDNEWHVYCYDELGGWVYYTYEAGGHYCNRGKGMNVLTSDFQTGGWTESRMGGVISFRYNSAGQMYRDGDWHGNAQYFWYSGGVPVKVVNNRTNLAVYFEWSGSLITKITDWVGRETSFAYDEDGRPIKIIGPGLCVTYYDYRCLCQVV